LLSVCLNAWSGTKEGSTPGVGIPQGPQPSYLLANLLLFPLDKQLISEAFKYYRYMDDIKIYGYSEAELRNVLVLIDNYLKGHGLSINSKKTGITLIDQDKEDATVKELRRFEVIGSDYTGDEAIINELSEGGLEKDVIKILLGLSDQSPGERDGDDANKKIESITDPNLVVDFWEKEINEVENELPKLFKEGELELVNTEKTDDIEFIRLSARYGMALRSISEYKQVKASDALLPYWLFALKEFNWRASNYVLTLQHYKGNKYLKEELLATYESEKNYECFRYHLVTCLNYNFDYTDRELRHLFKLLKIENSELVRYALYCMIIKHTDDTQLLSTMRVQLGKEHNNYIKLITLDFWKRESQRLTTMDELVKSIGL